MLTPDLHDKLSLVNGEVDLIRALIGSQDSAILNRDQLLGLYNLLDRRQVTIAEILAAHDEERQIT